MTNFTIHTADSAPDAARTTLASVAKKYGFTPNLLGILAENPAALAAYIGLGEQAGKAGLSPLETQIVQIGASVENECHFCVAAHTAISVGGGLDGETLNAVRENRPITNARHEALRQFTKKVVNQRGFVSDAETAAFLEAGFTRSDILAVIVSVALKTISNYTNHISETPVNAEFAEFAWTPNRSSRASAA